MGVVLEVPLEHQGQSFYSWYLLVPKSKGGVKPILELRNLNIYIRYVRFHMVTLLSILPTLTQNNWLAALDLQDAYIHMAILLSHRFLWFVVVNHHFQYTVLPFGLSSTPRIFTKCMVVVTAYIKKKGMHVFLYG